MIDKHVIEELLRRVPHPPEEPPPPGVTVDECKRFVRRTGIDMPESLKDWLMLTNGPCVGPGGFFGIRPSRPFLDIESRLQCFPEWHAKKWIPVASDGCGNYFVVPTNCEFTLAAPVVFMDTMRSIDSPSYIVSSDLGHFIIGTLRHELEDDGWPFSSDFVVRFDPEIIKCSGVPLPWEVD